MEGLDNCVMLGAHTVSNTSKKRKRDVNEGSAIQPTQEIGPPAKRQMTRADKPPKPTRAASPNARRIKRAETKLKQAGSNRKPRLKGIQVAPGPRSRRNCSYSIDPLITTKPSKKKRDRETSRHLKPQKETDFTILEGLAMARDMGPSATHDMDGCIKPEGTQVRLMQYSHSNHKETAVEGASFVGMVE
jgi:hypothetical protein